jgi:hypothetical protein
MRVRARVRIRVFRARLVLENRWGKGREAEDGCVNELGLSTEMLARLRQSLIV